MKIIQFTKYVQKIGFKKGAKPLAILRKKQIGYFSFLLLIFAVFASNGFWKASEHRFQTDMLQMNNFNESLHENYHSALKDSLALSKERQILVKGIEDKIVAHLYQIPDYSHVKKLAPYLQFNPSLLNQIPSTVPLENGDYQLSSVYGHRIHPISKKEKKHFGIDLAANSGKHIYATASGTIAQIVYATNGYGTHIIIQHRFGFETLYGHLDKVLVRKGEKIKQHELIGTVGSTGASTGYHLHYEILKNKKKVDPMYSLNFKRSIYKRFIATANE